ncbi:MAG: cytochrome c biogenesis protein CcdA [bacterium]|nr:cytochrome c biogenesis protein CcdA [bacterium]
MLQGLVHNLQGYLQASSPLALLAVLAGGIMTGFTPCVYPLIPITITFIGARASGSRKKAFLLSLAYALGIAITYTVLGLVASFSGRLFGQVQTSPLVMLVIGNIFIIMGLSMFGVFSFPWPNLVKNLPQTRSGFISSFLMGLVAGLVMGPCTAPVLAVLLAFVYSQQNVLFGALTLFVFAIGMNAILILAGTFAGLLVNLPKPGIWMERTKKILAWAMIFIGEYFLIQMGKMLL